MEETMSEEPKVERSIADELGKLGQQMASAAKAAWESDDRKKLQSELTQGIEKFSQELSTTLEKATESEQAKELRVKAERVVEEVRSADVIDEIRKGILTGLEVLNRELGKLVEKLDATPDVPSVVEEVKDTASEVVENVTDVVDDAVEPKAW
jgi:hypothetical protein